MHTSFEDAPQEWPVLLTTRIRSAAQHGHWAQARQLLAHGDGMARSLAGEYTLMIRGLAATIAVIGDVTTNDARFEGARTAVASALEELDPDSLQADIDDPAATSTAAIDALARRAEAFLDEQAELAAQVDAALAARDLANTERLLTVKGDESYLRFHDRLLEVMARSFEGVYRQCGRDGLHQFQLALAVGQRRGIETWELQSARDFTKAFSFLLKQHRGEFTVVETDDYWVIDQALCGSGGRLLRSGSYSGTDALSIVSGPAPITGDQDELPVYCTHCPGWNTIAPTEWFGHSHIDLADAARPDGSCTLRVPKNR